MCKIPSKNKERENAFHNFTNNLNKNLIKHIYDKICPFGFGLMQSRDINIDNKLIDLFKTFTLTNDDYKDCINKYRNYERCLFVFDPPYFCSDKTYKENYINVNEYINLIKIIVEQCEHFVFVTYSSDFVNYIVK